MNHPYLNGRHESFTILDTPMDIPFPRKGGRALEVGCGRGYNIEHQKPNFQRIIGVEFNPVFEQEFSEIDFRRNYFHTVYIPNELAYCGDIFLRTEILHRCHRVLRFGGYLVFRMEKTKRKTNYYQLNNLNYKTRIHKKELGMYWHLQQCGYVSTRTVDRGDHRWVITQKPATNASRKK